MDVKSRIKPCTPVPAEAAVGVAVRVSSPDPQHQEPADLDPVAHFRQQEYRAGSKGRFPNIPSWPIFLEHEELVAEIPLHEFEVPVVRKYNAPISRSRCCGGAGHHMYRHRRCECHGRD